MAKSEFDYRVRGERLGDLTGDDLRRLAAAERADAERALAAAKLIETGVHPRLARQLAEEAGSKRGPAGSRNPQKP
jgi:hypothetical protein